MIYENQLFLLIFLKQKPFW